MKKKICTTIFIVFITTYCNSQEKNGNQIFYADLIYGGASISIGSFNFGLSLNYQKNKHLFTFKTNETSNLSDDIFLTYLFFPLTIIDSDINSNEISFLYGRRYLRERFSYSFSGGISFIKYNEINDSRQIINREKFIGIPLEFSLHWFKNNKEKIKLFGLIPVGKPTGFGISTGIKVFGTISKKSYIGAGLTFGFGYYKNYN